MVEHDFDPHTEVCRACRVPRTAVVAFPSLARACRPRNKRYIELSETQRILLEFIRDRITAGDGFPSHSQCAERMGWKSPQSARDCLARLAIKGFLRRGAARSGYELTGLDVRESK